jgi:hypothetical protein
VVTTADRPRQPFELLNMSGLAPDRLKTPPRTTVTQSCCCRGRRCATALRTERARRPDIAFILLAIEFSHGLAHKRTSGQGLSAITPAGPPCASPPSIWHGPPVAGGGISPSDRRCATEVEVGVGEPRLFLLLWGVRQARRLLQPYYWKNVVLIAPYRRFRPR